MSCALILVSLLFFILGVLPGVNGSYLVPPHRDLAAHEQHLAKRNLSTFLNDGIPTQCNVECDVARGAAHGCSFMDCVCTVDNSNALVKCVNCVVALTPYADGIVGKSQLILDEWKNSYCALYWTPPMVVTIPTSTSSTPTATPTPNSSNSAPISAAFWVMTILSAINVSLLFLL